MTTTSSMSVIKKCSNANFFNISQEEAEKRRWILVFAMAVVVRIVGVFIKQRQNPLCSIFSESVRNFVR